MSVPHATNYRDVTGNTIIPPISSHNVAQFLHPLGSSTDKNARELYDERMRQPFCEHNAVPTCVEVPHTTLISAWTSMA
ncbi:hypothetical protein LSAT2_027824 [Lamellibrachia satsuma]|nr:hypothetical protein LSAT2_027824 [Lamellibrachia satsuma]